MTWRQFGKVRGMAKDKPGFYIWFNAVDAMAELSFEEKGRVYTAVEEYARDGVLPTFEDRFLRSVWVRLQADLDADDAKYRKNQRDNQIKGWKSDFKRNYAPAHGIDPNNEAALAAYIQQRLTAVDSGEPMSTNNNTISNINTNINTSASANTGGSPVRTAYGIYKNVFLTEEEYTALQRDVPDLDKIIDKLSVHIKSTGRTYASHEATVRKWAMEDAEKKQTEARPNGDWCSGITPEDYKNDIQFPWE